MAKQNINVGTAANDKKGDSLRAAFVKVNANFTELYTELGLVVDANLNLGAFEFAGSTISTTDSTAIVIDQAATVTSNLSVGGDLLPQTANGGDLGSSTLPWRSLYVSNNTIFLGGVPLGLDASNNLTVNGSRVGTTSYADLSDKPTSFSSLVNGSQTVNLSSSPVSGTTFSSGLTIHRLSGSMANITSDINKVLQIATQTSNGRQEWSFGTDGSLTLPQDGGIKSDTDIDITIDTPDSSTFNWQFGADGNLAVPGDINLSGGTISQYSQNGLTGLKLVANADQGQNVTIMGTGNNTFPILNYVGTTLSGITIGTPEGDWNFMNGNLTIPGDIKSNGNINIDINLSDSTLRRWQFGEDGNLTFPDNTNQTTAWTGSVSSLVNGSKTVSLGSNGTLTLPSQPNLLTNVNQIFTTKIYKDAKTPTPTPAEITTAYDYWLGEQEFYNAIRNEDASSIAPTTRSWAGLPPWEAYPLIVGFTGPGLPPPNNLATSAQSATNAYLSWKELVSNLEIVNGNQTIIFENTGNLILPSTVSMNGKLSLGPTLGGIHANQSTGIISIGDYIDADTGYGLAPSTTIAIGGAANVFQISTYGPPAKTWTFGKDGNLQIPGNLQISGDIRSEREINIDINLSDSTLRRWRFGEDGDTVFPTNISIDYGGGNNVQYPRIIADSGKSFSVQGQGSTGSAALAWSVDPESAGQYAAVGVTKEGGDNLAKVVLQAQSNSGDAATVKLWKFDETGALTFPDGTIQTTAPAFSFSVAADDSTQRAISDNESIKFIGAGGVTTASDAEGNITITGNKVIGEWLVTNGTSTYSFTLPSDGTYVMWVKGNIANGIITWNATASVTNTNVPAIGSQYAWNYTGGGSPILLTAIPDQIRGSAGTISTDATYAGTTSNRFDFGISNTSGANQTVYYGYTKI